MRILATTTAVVLLALTLMAAACDGGPGPVKVDPINPDIVLLSECCQNGYFWMGVWTEDRIYATKPTRLFRINEELEVTQTRFLFERVLDGRPINFIALNKAGTRLLVVRSLHGVVSLGSLHEYNLEANRSLKNNELPVLRDSSYAISSAVYLSGSDASKIVYYSYGNADKDLKAGYYLLDKDTGQDSLLFAHRSALGPAEVVNGFDISPDGTTLIYSLHYEARPPQAVEYSLQTGARDTLDVDFDRQLLWLQYSPDGNQLLYSNYPVGAGGFSVPVHSEVGIIDLASGEKRVLDVNTNPYGTSVQLAPMWSPNGRHILYGSAAGPVEEPPGAKGPYYLYVLKNVN